MNWKFEISRFSEKGKRKKNEDYIFPPLMAPIGTDRRVFFTCDGIGGENRGEVASELTCQYFNEYFIHHKKEIFNKKYLEDGLVFTTAKLKQYVSIDNFAKRMGTTIALVCFNQQSVVVGWIGDSRIYHIRNEKIKYRTKDHSLVQTLINAGAITEKEARSHPQKNIILKSVSPEDSGQMDFVELMDVEVGDYLFMCTDGVVESFDDQDLEKLFNEESSTESILKKMIKTCESHSSDNFSGYILKVIQKPN